MADKKVVLPEEELQKEYLIAEPKNARGHCKAIDIIVGILGLLGCVGLGLAPLLNGIDWENSGFIWLGCIYLGCAVILLIYTIIAIASKKSKLTGTLYPLSITLFFAGMCGWYIYLYLADGSVDKESTFQYGIVFGIMAGLSILSLVFYLINSKKHKVGPKLASLGFAIIPMVYLMRFFYKTFWVYYPVTKAMDISSTPIMTVILSLASTIGAALLVLVMVLAILGLAARLIDRGDNCVVVAKEVIEKEIPVEIIKEVKIPTPVKTRANGLVIIKSKKAEEEPAPAPEEGK